MAYTVYVDVAVSDEGQFTPSDLLQIRCSKIASYARVAALDTTRHLAASPDVASRLSNRPQAFLAGREFITHVWTVMRMARWWQLILTIVLVPFLGRLEMATSLVSGLYIMGFVLIPLMEEGAKAWSLQTQAGQWALGAWFAIWLPVVEALQVLSLAIQFHELTWGLVILRVLGVLLHLYTHFVLAYRLSLFGRRNRGIGSFITAVLIHGGFNAATSVCMLVV